MADGIITPCNVARSWHWFRQVTAPYHDSEFTKWQHPAMWQVAVGWHAMEFAQTTAILELYIWFRVWPYHRSRHVILCQCANLFSKSDRPQQKKTTFCRFSRWRISAILDCRSPIMVFLKLMHDSYRSSTDTKNALGCTDSCRLLSFWEHLLFAFWRQDPRWGISYSIGQTKSGAGTTKLAPSASWALNICLTASPVLFAITDLILVQISPKFNRTIRNPLPVYSETFVMMGVLVLLLGNKKRH